MDEPVSEAARVRRRLMISGRVQGVWYRGSMATEAERLGAAGWVRNLPDGRVEAVVEGPPAIVDRMIEWCRKGPPAARVREVHIEEEAPEGLSDFRIRG
ncbi:MAG: acylphosphatase [Deltaproteobacteria bacterium]|nr:MAG: acylphosphatase [Deltaproteobacteria bacterium]